MRALLVLTMLAFAGCGFVNAEKHNAEVFDRKCRSYGAKPGTQAYVQCRATLQAGLYSGM